MDALLKTNYIYREQDSTMTSMIASKNCKQKESYHFVFFNKAGWKGSTEGIALRTIHGSVNLETKNPWIHVF